MIESAWKVVTDKDGLTITGDSFSLTTNSSDPVGLDSVMSALQSVARGTYGQYCGLSRAIEAVGERWGMLVVRDLIMNTKSAVELHRGLPKMPLNLLSMRLREMAYVGIIEKADATDTDEDGNDRYQLTEYGRQLEDSLLAFGRWGTALLGDPRPEDIVTVDSLMVAMKAMFLPNAAEGRSAKFELHFEDIVIHVIVEDGQLEVGKGPLFGAPAIEPGPTLMDLLTRAISVEDAMATGTVKISGDPHAMASFISMFGLPKLATPRRSTI
jgi:DNA-binding HxlR family transcriptional regulator